MCFEYECYMNDSLGLKEIWVLAYLGPKIFWVHKAFIKKFFTKFFEYVLNLSGMCFEHEFYVNHS